MNDENLIPMSRRSKSEARESGRKGGAASGRARRDKRDSRERMKLLMELPCPDGKGGVLRSEITGKPVSVGEAIDTSLIKKALTGNVKAICAIYDLLGLNVMRVEADATVRDARTIEEIDDELERLRRIEARATGGEEEV